VPVPFFRFRLTSVYSMLQNRKPNGSISPRPGEKETDTEDERLKRDERGRAKSLGGGDEVRFRGAKRPQVVQQ
jgi:hypothetical protein